MEFFNRSVQLTLTNYGCESEQCEVAAQSDPESTGRGLTWHLVKNGDKQLETR